MTVHQILSLDRTDSWFDKPCGLGKACDRRATHLVISSSKSGARTRTPACTPCAELLADRKAMAITGSVQT
jgi:hypothetical protein